MYFSWGWGVTLRTTHSVFNQIVIQMPNRRQGIRRPVLRSLPDQRSFNVVDGIGGRDFLVRLAPVRLPADLLKMNDKEI